MRDEIGTLGESIFETIILRKTYGYYLFNPCFVGDKWAGIDYYVELSNADRPSFFLVQIKTTTLGYTRSNHNLKVSLSEKNCKKLFQYPAPTYLVGIDGENINNLGYILNIKSSGTKHYSSMPTIFELNEENRYKLWKEVDLYWKNSKNRNFKRGFNSYFKI